MLEAVADPTHPEHDEWTPWLAGMWGMEPEELATFDPAHFDLAEVNEALAVLAPDSAL